MKEHLGLPPFCYAPARRTCGGVVRIVRGESCTYGLRSNKAAEELNGTLDVSVRQAAAMEGGIYYGWNSHHADPENYTHTGDYIGQEEEELEHG